jgi:uridine kinase
VEEGTRGELLARLVATIESVPAPHPRRVAVDGPPAAGKTTLADDLAARLRERGRAVIRATIEGFLLPRAQRYRRGELSPEGCFYDSFDYDALRRVLLDPLGPTGDRRYQDAVYDKPTDTAVVAPVAVAPADAVLLFDGVFLLRPELIDWWDLRIFVSAAFETTVDRALIRDRTEHASTAEVERRWRARYIPSQELYLARARPAEKADILVENDDPAFPAWSVRAI